MTRPSARIRHPGAMLALAIFTASGPALGQDRLKTMPGYERFQALSREIPGSVKPGSLAVHWKDGG